MLKISISCTYEIYESYKFDMGRIVLLNNDWWKYIINWNIGSDWVSREYKRNELFLKFMKDEWCE